MYSSSLQLIVFLLPTRRMKNTICRTLFSYSTKQLQPSTRVSLSTVAFASVCIKVSLFSFVSKIPFRQLQHSYRPSVKKRQPFLFTKRYLFCFLTLFFAFSSHSNSHHSTLQNFSPKSLLPNSITPVDPPES